MCPMGAAATGGTARGTTVRFLPDYKALGLPGGLTEDMAAVLRRRAYDAAGVSPSTLTVWLDGVKLEAAKGFLKYAQLYLGAEGGYAHEKLAEGWEVSQDFAPILVIVLDEDE